MGQFEYVLGGFVGYQKLWLLYLFVQCFLCYYYYDVHIGCVLWMVPFEVYSSLLVLLVLRMLLYLLVCVLLHVSLEKDLRVMCGFDTICYQEW